LEKEAPSPFKVGGHKEMNPRKLIVVVVVLGVVVGLAVLVIKPKSESQATHNGDAHAEPPLTTAAQTVPAHFTQPPSLSSLGPTLPPERFAGQTREAYVVARAIPQTLAQLPCYCHCDRGMGHKSLHSCFEDDHASHCATCVDEALMAYRLQTEAKLSADQVREKIIEKYAGQ